MLKVLIADDEEKVCSLISHLVKWEKLGFEIVGVVHDGSDAYDFICEHETDVVITDIRMPGYNGMELIERVKEKRPDIHLVIISGYSQFDYAHNAIKFGVEDYLLKPLRQKELTATLMKIVKKHQKEVSEQEEKEHLRRRITADEKKVKQNFLGDLLSNPEQFRGEDAKEQVNKEYYYDFADAGYQVAVIMPMLKPGQDSAKVRQMLLDKTLKIVTEELQGICQESVCSISRGCVYCVFNGNARELQAVYRRLKKIRLEVSRLRSMFEGLRVFIALSDTAEQFEHIYECVEAARDALYNRFCCGTETFLRSSGEANETAVSKIVTAPWKKNFLSCVEAVDQEGLKACLARVRIALEAQPLKDGRLVYEVYKELLDVFYFGTHNYGITVERQYHQMLNQFQNCAVIQEVFDLFEDNVTETLRVWSEMKKEAQSKPIRLAKQYINEHYDQSLTLDDVSAQIGFHPTYFSAVFKKETGMNFSEYLINVRIEQAKQQLLYTSDTIITVAEQVGYTDIKYFSKLFKKVTGLTPSEFRKLYT